MRRVAFDEAGEIVFGIDVSHHNGVIDWGTAARAGVAFAYAKATEGEKFRDRRFPANWPGMRDAGILRGAYHFFRPAADAVAQAEQFCEIVGTLGPGDLPPVVDVEETPTPGEWDDAGTPQQCAAVLDAFIARVRQRAGRAPIVYTAKAFWNSTFGPWKPPSDVLLWIARWTPKPPDVPMGWSDWTFWQYSDAGAVAGVEGAVDLDRFQGDEASLRALAGIEQDPTAVARS